MPEEMYTRTREYPHYRSAPNKIIVHVSRYAYICLVTVKNIL